MAREFEGTWEEVGVHAPELAGRRVRVAVLQDEAPEKLELINPGQNGSKDAVLDMPTPGLVEGRHGRKPFGEWTDYPLATDITDEEFDAFEKAIADNRAMRRALAQERIG